ncbi:MAG: hypothetical protein KDE31_38680 [Caldilineaceae bacterium]|nr:hypothetical protein [Caldilineaceae bacterium]
MLKSLQVLGNGFASIAMLLDAFAYGGVAFTRVFGLVEEAVQFFDLLFKVRRHVAILLRFLTATAKNLSGGGKSSLESIL